MADKHTLDLAREWAEWADKKLSIAESHLHARAAADLISSLPDEWVSADALRKYIADWREGLATAPRGNYEEEMLYDLEDMLPTPPAPRTMAEVEWSDEEHHLAEATAAWAEGTASEVVMLHRNGDTIAVHQSAPHYTGLRELNPAILTPTGRKYRMEPEDDVASATGGVLTTQDVVDECRDVRKERATPEQQDLARDIFGSFPPEERHAHWAKPIPESAAPRPEDVPVFDPAYTYRDRIGNEWSYVIHGWRCYSTATGKLLASHSTPPAEYGPYTRIEA